MVTVDKHQQSPGGVSVRHESVVLPTQLPLPPDRYPAYLDNRVYQGSSGAVYPLPFHERIDPEQRDHEWDGVVLENEWVSLTLLPELGGRIAWGIDRTRGYDMFYRNQVIKPALVGLAGPWISGGIEFNWPQHHRPATFLPTSVEVEHEPDGAVTVWCSDHDPFARMKGMHGVRLRPDSAVIELRARLFNRTDDVQTFLWWANVAARAGDHYQAFFPTDVAFVADHAKRAVTAYPAADRHYYGWDYPAAAAERPGADRIDWYRNIPVPTSYMCVATDDDFFGGYDHEVGAGFVHVADRHVAPGKKLWTWGNSPFGWAWDRNLTEVDGPYVELMAGVYTDNQPDFTFLAPGETKTFSQFWYPIQDIGPVQQANLRAACSLTIADGEARVGVAVTRDRAQLTVSLRDAEGAEVFEERVDVGPGRPFVATVPLTPGTTAPELELVVSDGDDVLLAWRPRPADGPGQAEPSPATEPPAPSEIDSIDELFTTGLHLQQYRHPTRRPEPYWQEAVARDPGDSRSRTALAAAAIRRGEFEEAREHLDHAIARLTRRNPNPYDTEAHYRLGQALERSGDADGALAAYAKAAWGAPWRDAANFSAARVLARAGRNQEALDKVEGDGTPRDPHNRARCLEVVLLRRLGRDDEAGAVLARLRALDPLDVWAADLAGESIPTDGATLLDVALDHASVGELEAALSMLDAAAVAPLPLGQVNVAPLARLHAAHLLRAAGRTEEADAQLRAAEAEDPSWCFPSRPADLDMLTSLAAEPDAPALVHRLLGHQLYHLRRREDAIREWEAAVAARDDDPVTRRNLAVAAHNIQDDPDAAVAHYERARELAPGDSKLLHELDQLRKRTGTPPAERLAALEAEPDVVAGRDDLTTEFVSLLTSQGRADEAIAIMGSRHFQPWEGGEGEVLGAWDEAQLSLARDALAAGDAAVAESHLRAALEPPHSLGEGRHPLANRSHLLLALGDALAAQGREAEARQAWQEAASFVGDFQTMAAVPYSELTYYSVLAARRLGDDAAADRLVDGLAAYAEEVAATTPTVDYFATSLPSLLLFTDDLARRSRVRVDVLRAQAAALRGDAGRARDSLAAALAEDPNNVRAQSLARDLAAGR